MTAKEAVMDVLIHAPANATYDEIQYRIYIREKLERGLQAMHDGKIATPEEVEAEFAKWEFK